MGMFSGRFPKPIDVYLRTDGGCVNGAFIIIDTIPSLKSPVNVYAMGGVSSARRMILTAATGKKITYENTIVGFHALSKDDHDIYIDTEQYVKFWRKHSSIPEKWLERRDYEMIYFSGEGAIKYGVADEISSIPKT